MRTMSEILEVLERVLIREPIMAAVNSMAI